MINVNKPNITGKVRKEVKSGGKKGSSKEGWIRKGSEGK